MGASQSKKQRIDERASGLSPKEKSQLEEQKKRRNTRLKYTIIGVLIVLLIVVVVFVNSRLFTNSLTAVKVGDTSYTIAEVRYAYQTEYMTFYSNYSNYISYFWDTSKSLSEQTCSFDSSITWEDYFMNQAMDYLQQTTALYDAAVAEGYTLSEDEQAALDKSLDSLGTYASVYGYTKAGYISAYYGEGNTEATVRHMMTVSQIASDYAKDKQASYSYTDEELDAYYKENSDSYNTVTYLSATISGAADTDAGIDAETAMANARASAEAIIAACDGTLDSFRSAALAETGTDASEQTSYWSNTADYDWFTSTDRKEGDVKSVEGDSNVTVYCFESTETNDYNTVNVRHILIQAQDTDGDGKYSAAEKETAYATLLGIQAQWDGTEDNFIALANQYSEDTGSNTNGGLYENVYKGEMVDEFNAFCFGDRKSGDSAIVYGETSSYAGYHLVYFVGEGKPYTRVIADSAKRSSDYSDWQTTLLESYPLTKTLMFRYV